MKINDIIKRPLVTEKSSICQGSNNQYFFEVDIRATKFDVRSAVESVFNVKVVSVKTMNLFGKRKRVGRNTGVTGDWKKAMVTLKQGDRIEFLEGK